MKPTMICRTSLKCEEIYKPEDINLILSWISSDFKTVRTNKKIDFFNIPAGFDIETSSFSGQPETMTRTKKSLLCTNGHSALTVILLSGEHGMNL